MYIAAIVVLALLCAILLNAFLSLERSLRQAERQIRAQMDRETTVRLNLSAPNAAAEELFRTVNELLELRLAEQADWQRREHTLRRQISNMSHDLRTPLTSIMGYLQLLEREDLPAETRREYLAVAEGRARTLQSLIASFYELARMEGGEWQPRMEWVDLARELSDQLAAAYQQLEEGGLAVEVDVSPDLPPVWADQGGVVRVFSNLLTNALRHGTDKLTVTLRREGDSILSRFSNRAEGMTAEDASHVFERFYTADQTRSGRDTGLGLAIVDALTRRMGHAASATWQDGVFTVEVRWSLRRRG